MNLASSPALRHDPHQSPQEATRREEFAALYDEHRQRLYLFCLSRTQDPALAEDLVQEIFAKAYRHLSAFDRSRPFWPWLVTIAGRACVDVHRRDSYARARLSELRAAYRGDSTDPTATAVFGRMESRRLEHMLAALPTRQRVALQLFAFDGWSYPEIADQLGCTVATIKQLIVRARARLRETGGRALGALGTAVQSLASRLHQVIGRLPGILSGFPETAPAWSQAATGVAAVSVFMAGIGAVVVVPEEASGGVVEAVQLAPPDEAVRPDPSAVPGLPPAPRTALGPADPVEPAWRAPQHELEKAAYETVAPMLEDPASDDPQEGQTSHFVVSPHYEEDRTVFAFSGVRLLVTRDGGTTWRRLPARGLGGLTRLMPAPRYPADNRIFAVTTEAIQVSRNGGESFETLAAVPWGYHEDAVMSPEFSDGDPVILFKAGGTLFRYRDDTGIVQPVLLEGLDAGYTAVHGVTYSAGYADDRTVLVSVGFRAIYRPSAIRHCRVADAPMSADGIGGQPYLRCHAEVELPKHSLPIRKFLRAPDAGSATFYAVAGSDLYTSDDGGHSLRRTGARAVVRQAVNGYLMNFSGDVRDAAMVPGTEGRSSIVAQHRRNIGALPPLERTDDGGATWAPVFIDLPGFEGGASAVTVTPTGRILAAGGGGGLACSTDDGVSWAPTCAPPEA